MRSSDINAVCPYFTMFPVDFPLRVLANEYDKSHWVFDPFCGRGTTNFAARLKGLPSVGVDSSPIATAIAKAKTVTVSHLEVVICAKKILNDAKEPTSIPEAPFWGWAYHHSTLFQLCRIREELLRSCKSPARKVLRAIVLGALHGPLCKGPASYFSNQCTRTFAPKPAYALKFWKQRAMKPPLVDVLNIVQRRAERLLSKRLPNVDGKVIQGDSRAWVKKEFEGRFSWVITSPPYYGMNRYIPDQWLRNWFVGGTSTVDYSYPEKQLQHSSPENFSQQLRAVWVNAANMSTPNAHLICRFGGIHTRKQDCVDILRSSFEGSGWRLTQIRNAGSSLDGKRQATQFGKNQSQHPRKEYDAYARRDD